MSYFYAECHSSAKNSHKFYELAYDAGSDLVVAEYGRLPGYGSKGTRVRFVYRCASPYGASLTYDRKVREKLGKGYARERRGYTSATRFQPVQVAPVPSKTTVVAVSPDLIEQQLDAVLGTVETKKVEDTLARFRHLEMATPEELATAVPQAAPSPPSEAKSKRFEHLDLSGVAPAVLVAAQAKSKRFKHLDL